VSNPPPYPGVLELIEAANAWEKGPAFWADWKERMLAKFGSLPAFPWDAPGYPKG
jgi:hypothetical protein